MTTEMVERLAAALAENDTEYDPKEDGPWSEWPEHWKERERIQARAAIRAMENPTSDMGLAGYAAWDVFGEEAVMGPEELLAIWRAMCRTALGEDEGHD